MSAPALQRCLVVDPPHDWPELQVLLVAHPVCADLAAGRDAARRRVRELLLHHAGPEIAAPFLASARAAAGACRASISHEHSHSLLAWCEQGYVGVDTVSPQRVAELASPALAALAALYLGPAAAALISRATAAASARTRFADAWARHEARLKCLGLDLDEWSPALQVKLAGCSTARVAPPSQNPEKPAVLVSRIAWRSQLNPPLG